MDNEFCPICGDPVKKEGKFVNRLTDGTVVCERCAAKTRFLYPVKSGARIESERKFHRTGKLSGSLNTEYYEYRTLINPVEEMTLDEFRRALDETDQKRSAEIAEYRQYKCVIREKYNWYDAIFQVEHAVIGKGGLLLPAVANAYGYVLCGSFWFADKVRIIRGGNSWEGEIGYIQRNIQEGYPDWLARPAKYVKEEIKECRAHFQNAGEGFPYVLIIKTKNADLKPGDLIVKGGQKKL